MVAGLEKANLYLILFTAAQGMAFRSSTHLFQLGDEIKPISCELLLTRALFFLC